VGYGVVVVVGLTVGLAVGEVVGVEVMVGLLVGFRVGVASGVTGVNVSSVGSGPLLMVGVGVTSASL